ncbi:MAG TPA: HEAT repeat domain-containing protein [Acidimicrobiales bacterium]|nr:HEAT repeat domain-containing protein [Acidimicrobiales bacterium]
MREHRGVVNASDRRRTAALAGHTGAVEEARALLQDPDPGVRGTALAALARLGQAGPAEVGAALRDPSPEVRRRACRVAVGVRAVELAHLLDDDDAGVVEVAAWAVGERGDASGEVVDRLSAVATGHDDALCREAAVAALGAVGDERGLPAILSAIRDKPAIRRRAVIALAPFEGPEVDAALERALTDRDWQVRQAAEDLSS